MTLPRTVEAVDPRRLVSRFDVVRTLGSGGMGTVYAARDRATGGRLAVKALRQLDGDALLHFKQEFRVLWDLVHPHVVRVGELIEDGGRFYLTMQLVDGENLLDWVRPGGPRRATSPSAVTERAPPVSAVVVTDAGAAGHGGVLHEARLRAVLAQLASALVALHAAGVVHRDVKPNNVIVAPDGHLTLLDFGLATRTDDLLEAAELAGTLEYMAPEQIGGRPVSAETDWYAVGVVLYEALTGQLPWRGRGVQLLLEKRDAPRALPPGLPADLCELCTDLLEPNPARRPGDEAVAARLGLDLAAERARASFRSQLQFTRGQFVGRQRELTALHEALARAGRERDLVIVRVSGESGLGKSALVRRFLDEVALRGGAIAVLSGRCYEREAVPLRGLDHLVDALARELRAWHDSGRPLPAPEHGELVGRVFPVLRAFAPFAAVPRFPIDAPPPIAEVDPFEARRLAVAALREVLCELSDSAPLIVHLDDAQWMDGESATLLDHLLRGDSAPRALLIASERPRGGDAHDPIAPLGVGRDVLHLTLEPLGPAESATLATALLERGVPSGKIDAATLARHSGGHPLFIHELVLHGALSGSDDLASQTLEGALSARIAAQSPAARRLLELLSVAAAPLRHDALRLAADLDAGDYPWLLSTLRAENLATFHSLGELAEVQVHHDRLRGLVLGGLDAHGSRDAHGRLARALEHVTPDAHERIAMHYRHAGERVAWVRAARLAAERAAASLAFEQAASFWELALEGETETEARAGYEEARGTALANAGRGEQAAEAFLRSATGQVGLRSLELRRRAGEQLLRSGHVERALALLSDVLRELGLAIPKSDLGAALSLTRSLARVMLRRLDASAPTERASPERALRQDACWTLAVGLCMVHQLRSTDFQARGLLLALGSGEPDRVLKTSAMLAATLGLADGVERRIARRLMDHARTLAGPNPKPENQAWLALDEGVLALGVADFATCEARCAHAEALFRDHCTGVAWEVVTSQAFVLWAMAYQGKVRPIAERLPELVAQARARGDRYALSTLLVGPLNVVGLAADEPARVRRECAEITPEWSTDSTHFQRLCAAFVLAQTDLYEGHARYAWERIDGAWHLLGRTLVMRVQFHRADFTALRARAALGSAALGSAQRSRWLARALRDANALDREGLGFARAFAAAVRAGAAHLSGDAGATRRGLAQARDLFAAQGMQLHAAACQLALGHAARDRPTERAARKRLVELGAVHPDGLARLWVPGVVPVP